MGRRRSGAMHISYSQLTAGRAGLAVFLQKSKYMPAMASSGPRKTPVMLFLRCESPDAYRVPMPRPMMKILGCAGLVLGKRSPNKEIKKIENQKKEQKTDKTKEQP